MSLSAETAMSDVPNKPAATLKCPLCDGRGEMEKEILLDRLREKDLARKVETYLRNFVAADANEELHDLSPEEAAKHKADSWNLTHFMWRRSAKE